MHIPFPGVPRKIRGASGKGVSPSAKDLFLSAQDSLTGCEIPRWGPGPVLPYPIPPDFRLWDPAAGLIQEIDAYPVITSRTLWTILSTRWREVSSRTLRISSSA